MMLAGDEIGHTQNGNNNAYCQDNEITWIHWDLKPEDQELLEFVRLVIRLRKEHPILHRRKFLQGRPIRGSNIKDIVWLSPEGREMTDEEWDQSFARCLGMFLAGAGLNEVDERGHPIVDDNLLLLFNAHYERIDFKIPDFLGSHPFTVAVDTARQSGNFSPGDVYPLEGRSLALLIQKEDRKQHATKS